MTDAAGFAKSKFTWAKYVNHGTVVAAGRLLYQLGNASGSPRTEVPYQTRSRIPGAPAAAHTQTFVFAGFPFTWSGADHVVPRSWDALTYTLWSASSTHVPYTFPAASTATPGKMSPTVPPGLGGRAITSKVIPVLWPGFTWPRTTSMWSPRRHTRYRFRYTGSNRVWPHVASPVTPPPPARAFMYTSPPTGSVGPVEPGEENTRTFEVTCRNVRKTVLSLAEAVGPLSTANHCRSFPELCTPTGFFRQLFPPSFDTATPRFTSASRSTKYAKPWSSVTTSVSPPPGGGSGRSPTESIWYESPASTDLWTKLFWVVVPHGPDSQMFPARSTWTIGSPSVRCGSTMTLGANTIPPVGRMGFGVGPPGVKKRLACPLYPELNTRNGTTRTS